MLRDTENVSTLYYDAYRDECLACIEHGSNLPADLAHEVGSYLFGPLRYSSARFRILRYFGSPHLVMAARESVINIRINGQQRLMLFYAHDMLHRNMLADEAYQMSLDFIRYGRLRTAQGFVNMGNLIRFNYTNRYVVVGTEHWEVDDNCAFMWGDGDLVNELRLL